MISVCFPKEAQLKESGKFKLLSKSQPCEKSNCVLTE